MNGKKYFILFAFVSLLFSCTKGMQGDNSSFEQIHFSNEYISLNDSLMFKFIPLETTDSCLIGSISDIQIKDNRIFVLEGRKSQDIFVFNMNGKFIAKIGKKGNGPGRYIHIADFDIDAERRLIVLSDMHQELLLFYDLDSYKFKFSVKTDFYYNHFSLLSDGKALFFGCNGFENPNDLNDPSPYYILVADSLMAPENTYYKADFITSSTLYRIGKNNLYRYNKEIYAYHHLFPYVWKYKDHRIEPIYQFNLEGYTFPDITFLKEESKTSNQNWDYTHSLSRSKFITNYMVHESNDIISLSIQKNNMPIQAIYNKKSKKGYIFPLKEYFRSLNLGMLMFPVTATDEYIVGSIQMNEDIERVKDNMMLYKYIENRTLEDNPILCLFKWKYN